MPWVALGVLTADVRMGGPLDRLEHARLRRPAPARPRWTWVSAAGQRWPVAGLTGCATAAAVVGGRTAWWRPAAFVLGGVLLRSALCRVIGRERPPASWWLVEPDGPSFPSRHTTWAALAVAGLLLPLPGRLRPVVGAAGVLGVAAVGDSRVRLGVHWPTDVLGAVLLTVGWSGGVACLGKERQAGRRTSVPWRSRTETGRRG